MRRIKKFVLVAGPLGLVACASVLGFEDAKDRPADGGASGVDATPAPVGEVVASNVQGIVCAPKPPDDTWQGPLIVTTVRGPTLPPMPDCIEHTQKAIDANSEPNAPPLDCKCACDATPLGACEKPTAKFFSDKDCTTACPTAPEAVPNRGAGPTCTAFAANGCNAKKEFATITPAKPAGACTPIRTNDQRTPHSWGAGVRLCGPKNDVAAECDSDKSQIAQPALPYELKTYCIATAKAADCPPTYPEKRTIDDPNQVTDGRGCNECKCGPATGPCTGVLHTWDSTACSGGEVKVSLPAAGCVALGDNNTAFEYEPGANVTGSCPPSGGEATGTFSAAPITLCCRSS